MSKHLKTPLGRFYALTIALALVFVAYGGTDASTTPRIPPRTALVSNVTFVVFDTETTGFSPTSDRVVEVGVVKFRNGKVLEEKSWLIDPERPIPYWSTKVHHITDNMVKGKPTFKEFAPEFEKFIEGSVLMAHNARFDIAFMAAEMKRAGREIPPNTVIDSLNLFRQWYPGSKSHSLSDIVKAADIQPGNFHRALDDSMYVFLIFDQGMRNRSIPHLGDLYEESDGPLRF